MRMTMRTKLSSVKKTIRIKAGMEESHLVTFTGGNAIFKAAKHGNMAPDFFVDVL